MWLLVKPHWFRLRRINYEHSYYRGDDVELTVGQHSDPVGFDTADEAKEHFKDALIKTGMKLKD